jgi:hypothetical protein
MLAIAKEGGVIMTVTTSTTVSTSFGRLLARMDGGVVAFRAAIAAEKLVKHAE